MNPRVYIYIYTHTVYIMSREGLSFCVISRMFDFTLFHSIHPMLVTFVYVAHLGPTPRDTQGRRGETGPEPSAGSSQRVSRTSNQLAVKRPATTCGSVVHQCQAWKHRTTRPARNNVGMSRAFVLPSSRCQGHAFVEPCETNQLLQV